MPQQAQERPQDAPAGNPGTETSPDNQGAQKGTQGDKHESESFSREYVEQLRNEAKDNRVRAQRADFLATEVRRLAVREATRGVLTDPEALAWSDDWTDPETGLPDHDRITAAAEVLALEKPWLARPRGDVGQGQHGSAQEPMSLSALLRA